MFKVTLLLILLVSVVSFAQENEPYKHATAIFAGGCFWCSESDFEKVDGVIDVVSGYTGGHLENPSYKQVSAQNTGHYEAVKVSYNPEKVSYRQLVDFFWETIDPTDPHGQFCDKGPSYQSVIFFSNKAEQEAISDSKNKLEQSKALAQPIVTEVLPTARFYLAEDYHQNYYNKNPIRYKYYRSRCGRDKRLKKLWGEKNS